MGQNCGKNLSCEKESSGYHIAIDPVVNVDSDSDFNAKPQVMNGVQQHNEFTTRKYRKETRVICHICFKAKPLTLMSLHIKDHNFSADPISCSLLNFYGLDPKNPPILINTFKLLECEKLLQKRIEKFFVLVGENAAEHIDMP